MGSEWSQRALALCEGLHVSEACGGVMRGEESAPAAVRRWKRVLKSESIVKARRALPARQQVLKRDEEVRTRPSRRAALVEGSTSDRPVLSRPKPTRTGSEGHPVICTGNRERSSERDTTREADRRRASEGLGARRATTEGTTTTTATTTTTTTERRRGIYGRKARRGRGIDSGRIRGGERCGRDEEEEGQQRGEGREDEALGKCP